MKILLKNLSVLLTTAIIGSATTIGYSSTLQSQGDSISNYSTSQNSDIEEQFIGIMKHTIIQSAKRLLFTFPDCAGKTISDYDTEKWIIRQINSAANDDIIQQLNIISYDKMIHNLQNNINKAINISQQQVIKWLTNANNKIVEKVFDNNKNTTEQKCTYKCKNSNNIKELFLTRLKGQYIKHYNYYYCNNYYHLINNLLKYNHIFKNIGKNTINNNHEIIEGIDKQPYYNEINAITKQLWDYKNNNISQKYKEYKNDLYNIIAQYLVIPCINDFLQSSNNNIVFGIVNENSINLYITDLYKNNPNKMNLLLSIDQSNNKIYCNIQSLYKLSQEKLQKARNITEQIKQLSSENNI